MIFQNFLELTIKCLLQKKNVNNKSNMPVFIYNTIFVKFILSLWPT